MLFPLKVYEVNHCDWKISRRNGVAQYVGSRENNFVSNDDSFEERFLDVLYDLEFAIVSVFLENPDLADSNVDRVLEGLIRVYSAEINRRAQSILKLNSVDELLFERVRVVCEKHVRQEQETPSAKVDVNQISGKAAEIVDCLKRIRLSVRRWTTRGGRQ